MYRFCKLPMSFDPARLRADLETACAAAWIPHFVPSNYEGDWSAIPLRSIGGRENHILSDPVAGPEQYEDTPTLGRCAYFRQLLDGFACPVTAVRLLKLSPGSSIKEHRDLDLSFETGVVRLHIPVTTNPSVEFFIEGEPVRMKEGECWYIDATLPHRLANRGTTDRVHIVFDCLLNDWLRARLEQGGFRPRRKDFFEARGVRRKDLDKVVAALKAQGSDETLRLALELEAAALRPGDA